MRVKGTEIPPTLLRSGCASCTESEAEDEEVDVQACARVMGFKGLVQSSESRVGIRCWCQSRAGEAQD